MRISVDIYHRMIAAGILTAGDRIELLSGRLVEKTPKTPAHSVITGSLQDIIAAQLPAAWHVRNQEPITLSDSEPEPDLAVVRGSYDDYARSHPGPTDIAFLIEVADSTVRDDRWKRAIYSEAGIPVYLIINLPDQSVEFYSSPSSAGYRVRRVHGMDDEVSLTVAQGTVCFRLRDVLPPPAETSRPPAR